MKQKDPLLYGVIGVLIGAVIVWFLATNAINTNQYGMMQMMGIRSNNTNTPQQFRTGMSTIDRHFIEQMIPHHQDAITMSQLALTKAQKSEVKLLAQNIIDSQSKEIEQMKAWYKQWYGKDVPENEVVMGMHGMQQSSGMHMGMMGDSSDITRLENAEDFDRAFVEEMIPHHQMAVMMARMLKNGTQRNEMKQLADDIITAQIDEIDQMREWLQTWE